MDWVVTHSDTLLEIGRLVFEALLLVAALTPTDWDDNALERIKNLAKKLRGAK